MKLKEERIDRLVDCLMRNYQAKDLLLLKTTESQVGAKIKDIIAKNFSQEEEIEQEARKMLASHAADAKDIDPYKMFLLIKQKLAEKRGFVL